MRRLVLLSALVIYSCATLFAFAQPARHDRRNETDGDSCGIIWDPPILLSDTTYDAYSPKIALSGDDTVHITWESDYRTNRLPYKRSANGQFEHTRDLTID
jgi:hypothetical protein